MAVLKLNRSAIGRDVVDAIRKAVVATGGNFQVNNGRGYGIS